MRQPGPGERNPTVEFLEYEFEGWLGDSLVTSFPCFMVTTALSEDLQEAGLSGFELARVLISQSEVFKELQPTTELPAFQRLMVLGKVEASEEGTISEWSGHDVSLDDRADLYVTHKALSVFRQHPLEHCEIIERDLP